MAKTLYEYYTSKGQALPSVAARAPIAAQYGIQNYKGTAEQNNLLLSKLEATSPVPAPAGTSNPLPSGAAATPAPGAGAAFAPSAGTETAGDLGNLRIALREALNEAARNRVEKNFNAAAPLGGGVPGTLGAVVDMIRGGIKAPVETTFSDIISGYKDATDAKRKEIDRINQLRLEYGSLVPSNVQDLSTALDLIAPSVDKERRMALEKMAKDQAADNDVQSWAESYAKGEVSIGSVPAGIRTAVKVAADKIKTRLATEMDTELKDQIALKLDKGSLDFNQLRDVILGGGQIGSIDLSGLTAAEQRNYLDYVDGLENTKKEQKKKGGKGIFSIFGGGNDAGNQTTPATIKAPAPLFGPTSPGAESPVGSLKPFDDAFVKPFRDLLKQK